MPHNGGRMEGKRVLVTGSGTGIGRGVALEFAKEGAAVALHYAHSDEGARSAVNEIKRAGGEAEAFQADLGDLEQDRALAAEAIEYLGGLDVLVNNAGITMNKPFLQVTPEQYDTLYNVNMRGMFFVTQSVAPTMVEQGCGAVINPGLEPRIHRHDGAHGLCRDESGDRGVYTRTGLGDGT